IGMVRRTVQTIAGLRTYDLVAARVGKMSIDAAPSGQFTVSVEPAPDTIRVVLRISTSPAASVTLPFASGQEYDVVLRDASGKVVYTWSDGQMFTQALHELTVTGEWSATVAIPRPAEGSYTVQAWMTTSGGAPRYAATVPVAIGALK